MFGQDLIDALFVTGCLVLALSVGTGPRANRPEGGLDIAMSGKTRGVRQISEIANGMLDPILARRAGISTMLLGSWEEIAGPEFADCTRPEDDPLGPPPGARDGRGRRLHAGRADRRLRRGAGAVPDAFARTS